MIINFFKKILGIKPPVYYEKIMQENFAPIKVSNWQRRQARENLFTESLMPGVSLKDVAKNKLKAIQDLYVHTTDFDNYGVLDYWPTVNDLYSSFVMSNKPYFHEDCDGFAIAMWESLYRSQYQPYHIGMCYVHKHMFCTWHPINIYPDFWVLDNGYLSTKMIKASKLFPIKRDGLLLEPKWGFNLNNWWKFERRDGEKI